MQNIKIAIVIPAREKSTRFPGKPLANILGQPMILHVWEKCIQALDKQNVFIATDSDKIKNVCLGYGMNVIMTNESCLTGTDRVYEASLKIDADILINVQGDEPLISPDDIKLIIDKAKLNPTKIINAMTKITSEKEFFSNSVPKVIFNQKSNLLYMSRAGIPSNKKHSFIFGYKQVCIYAFPKDSLELFYKYGKKTTFEEVEDIEILRFLELGYSIEMVKVSEASIAVDFPQDIKKVEKILKGY